MPGNASRPVSGAKGSGSTVSGAELLRRVQRLARRSFRATQGRAMPPSGARIFYYTRLVLLRRGVLPSIEPDEQPLGLPLAEQFLETAPHIARQLATDFKRAIRFVAQPREQGRSFLTNHPLRRAPELAWAPEHLAGISRPLRQLWQALWNTAWSQGEREHLARLLPLLNEGRLLVTAVAPLGANDRAALRLLNGQLALDRQRQEQRMRADMGHAWPPPVADVYLYDEPLDDWLLRPLLSARWLFRLCQALAALAEQVPALVRQRAAALGIGWAAASVDEMDEEETAFEPGSRSSSAEGQQRYDDLPQRLRRRIPPLPQGQATAEAIFYYTVTAWRRATFASNPEPLLPDARLLAPTDFRALVALAIQVTEHLLWDETLEVRAQPPQTSARLKALREAILPRRLRQLFQRLRHRCATWLQRAQASPFSAWAAWEQPLQLTLLAASERLAASPVPSEITSERLHALLLAPLSSEASPYLYTSSLTDWLWQALPEQLPGGNELLAFCQMLAGEAGIWPRATPGAPADAGQAALAIFWYCKLALEARLGGTSGQPGGAAAPSGTFPQREDGGPVIWLGAPLTPAALELATVLAPLITRVLYHSAIEAARQKQPLLVARLKAEDPASWNQVEALLRERAKSLGYSNVPQVVGEALEKLRQQMERLVLPADVTHGLLAGERVLLGSLDFWNGRWYTVVQNSYQFLGEIIPFARRFIRPPSNQETLPLDEHLDELEEVSAQEQAPADITTVGDETVRTIMALIVQAGDAYPTLPASGQLDARDARFLVRRLLAAHTGRSFLERLDKEGAAEAQTITRRWLADSSKQPGQAERLRPTLDAPAESEQIDGLVALVRLLACEPVQNSADVRYAVGRLFELPMRLEDALHTPHPPLGMLERLAAWTHQPAQRDESMRALEALGQLAPTQRRILSARLLARTPIQLMLTLLERSGWRRPSWLQENTFELSAQTAPADLLPLSAEPKEEEPDEDPSPALVLAGNQTARLGSPQLFQVGRRGWLMRLAQFSPEDAWRARSLTGEWLGVHFWSGLWLERPHEGQAALFYRTLFNALPKRLFHIIGAAWSVASAWQLAPLCELIGLTGCMPPQLPAQLDAPAFFQAMQRLLPHRSPAEREDKEDGEQTALRRIRLELQVARRRILSCFLAIAGMRTDQERKVLLAAFSLAQGDANRLNRWIEGQPLSPAECHTLYEEVKRWQSQTAIKEADISGLLLAAGEQIRSVWRQLRREYS